MPSIDEMYDKIVDRDRAKELLKLPPAQLQIALASMTPGRRAHFLGLLKEAGGD